MFNKFTKRLNYIKLKFNCRICSCCSLYYFNKGEIIDLRVSKITDSNGIRSKKIDSNELNQILIKCNL